MSHPSRREAPSHYEHPAAYAALLDPDAGELDRIAALVSPWLGEVRSVLDPACGPAGYLVPWACRGCRVAGNDLEPAMIAFAAERLRGCAAVELTVGDMAALDFAQRDIDLALNLNMSVGHLPDDERVLAHLRAVHRHLRPGGVYLLALTVLSGTQLEQRADVVFRSGWQPLGTGRQAAITYTSLERDPGRRREQIEVTLRLRGGPLPPVRVVERYPLLTFTPAVIDTLARQARFEPVAWRTSDGDRWDPIALDDEVEGDVVGVLRAA